MSEDRKDLPPARSTAFLERVRETVQTYLGRQGDTMDRGLTLRDLFTVGLIEVSSATLNGRQVAQPVIGPGPVVTTYTVDLTPAPTPTGVTVTAAISNLIIECDDQNYPYGNGHDRTVVYGAQYSGTGPLPTFADAVELTQFTGVVGNYATNPSTEWHIWAKWKTRDGVLSAAPAGGANGIVATTGQDVSSLIEALAGEITESELATSLSARIDLIDGPSSLPGSVAARVSAEATARATAITAEATARAAAVTAEATARGTAITNEATIRQAGDDALALQVSLVTAGVAGGFDYGKVWYFDAGVEGWTSTGATQATPTPGLVEVTSSGTDPAFISPSGLAVNGATYPVVKAAITRLAGSGWDGSCFYATSGTGAHGISSSYVKTIAAPTTFGVGDRAVVEFAMDSLTTGGSDWINHTIDQIRLDFGATSGDVISVDWIAIGRNAPGASVAGLLTEQQARIDADAAEAAARTTLAAQVSTNTADILTEQTTRATADTALSTSITALTATVAGNTAAITTEQTTRATADTALSSSITALTSTVSGHTSQIAAEQTARADADTALTASLTSLTSTVSGHTSQIATEQTTRASADTALASSITSLTTTVTGHTSQISTEQTTRADADTALAASITALTSTVSGNTAAIATEQTTRASADTALSTSLSGLTATVAGNTAAITAEATARSNADSTLASSISSMLADVNSNTAAIAAESTARASGDSANASAITTLTSTVSGNTAAISTEATTRATQTGYLGAQYTVRVDVNGVVGGYGLSGTSSGGAAATIDFGIRANKFYIMPPLGSGDTGSAAFTYLAATTTINGVSRPAGLYVTDAFIGNGTIDNAKIGTLAVDTAKIADAAVSTAKITDAAITSAKIGTAAVQTAHITDANITTAKIANAAITTAKIGTAQITTALIADATISNVKILDGAITASKISVTQLDAISATIGVLRTATSGARMEIRDDVIKVYDSAGVLRVRLGNLSL